MPKPAVNCDVSKTELQSEDGSEIPGVILTCSKCLHETESFGTTYKSIRRCLALMRQQCPQGESNFYSADGSDDPHIGA